MCLLQVANIAYIDGSWQSDKWLAGIGMYLVLTWGALWRRMLLGVTSTSSSSSMPVYCAKFNKDCLLAFLLFIPYILSKVFCMQTVSINTRARTPFVDITAQVADAVKDAGFTDGMVNVFVPHTTAGVARND